MTPASSARPVAGSVRWLRRTRRRRRHGGGRERERADVGHRAWRPGGGVPGQHDSRQVDRDWPGVPGDEGGADRPGAGSGIQHGPACQRMRAHGHELGGDRPVDEFGAQRPAAAGAGVRVGTAPPSRPGAGLLARLWAHLCRPPLSGYPPAGMPSRRAAAAACSCHQASSSASPSAFSHPKVAMMPIRHRSSCFCHQPPVAMP